MEDSVQGPLPGGSLRSTPATRPQHAALCRRITGRLSPISSREPLAAVLFELFQSPAHFRAHPRDVEQDILKLYMRIEPLDKASNAPAD